MGRVVIVYNNALCNTMLRLLVRFEKRGHWDKWFAVQVHPPGTANTSTTICGFNESNRRVFDRLSSDLLTAFDRWSSQSKHPGQIRQKPGGQYGKSNQHGLWGSRRTFRDMPVIANSRLLYVSPAMRYLGPSKDRDSDNTRLKELGPNRPC